MSTPRVAASTSAAEHCFVVPALDGPITGGTSYNRELLAALSARARVRVLEQPVTELRGELLVARWVWVDSLYLADVPALARRVAGRLALILHYLPSFVAHGRAVSLTELSQTERRALLCANAFLVPSAFMRDAIEALVVPQKKPIFVVEPGTRATLGADSPRARAELRVALVGNVVPGKGIEPFLRALEAALAATDRLSVSIIGSLKAESDYAECCQRLASQSPALRERVRFLGALSPPETLAWLARSDLFVSASRMESYGMALREARVLGLPVLARTGGNTRAHVDLDAGGELAANDAGLALACVTLAREPALYGARALLARARAPRARPWSLAAQEFMTQVDEWEK